MRVEDRAVSGSSVLLLSEWPTCKAAPDHPVFHAHFISVIDTQTKPRRTYRWAAQLVWCPLCGACAGDRCVNEWEDGAVRNQRPAYHDERHAHAIKMGAKALNQHGSK